MFLWGATVLCAQTPLAVAAPAVQPAPKPARLILLISEQNIEGPQRAWWASEVDLSAVESTVAAALIQNGYVVLEPSVLSKVIEKKPAFRTIALSEKDIVQLGNLSQADFVVAGNAVASAGSLVPQSTMRSCFANVTARLIRVKDGKVKAQVNASGNSAHMDVITGGKEALMKAGDALSAKIIDALKKEGEAQ